MKSTVLFQNQPAIEIRDESSHVLISSAHGARVLRWAKAGREIITWPEEADWSRVLKVRGGDPVLFPFVARHFVDGKMELWRDAEGTVRPMPMHGFARDAKFSVVEDVAADAVRMRLTDSEATRDDYPFAFQFDVIVALHPDARLEIRFETTNRSERPMPYYAGHHFYLALPHRDRSDWTLELPCAAWGRQTSLGAIQREPATAEILRIDDPALVDRFQIEPRTGTATLRNARTHQRLIFDLAQPRSAPWYAVTTWTQTPESDFYCVEPWLGLPNAIHHGEGLRWVAPGATETATCLLDAGDW
jgi:galactose mutarotase-like enzyme